MNVNKGRLAGDFAVGCLTVLLIAVFVPVFVVLLKIAFWLAVPLAILFGAFVGVVLLGKLVRKIF